jgi:hypothetical protein
VWCDVALPRCCCCWRVQRWFGASNGGRGRWCLSVVVVGGGG